jgi:hypothetical protein
MPDQPSTTAAPFPGPWEHEVNPDILRSDARWDDGRAAHLAEQALELRERSDRFTATAEAKRRKASELEDEERRRA